LSIFNIYISGVRFIQSLIALFTKFFPFGEHLMLKWDI
jgi:hypothetical protein